MYVKTTTVNTISASYKKKYPSIKKIAKQIIIHNLTNSLKTNSDLHFFTSLFRVKEKKINKTSIVFCLRIFCMFYF